jgi:hypothetical protein
MSLILAIGSNASGNPLGTLPWKAHVATAMAMATAAPPATPSASSTGSPAITIGAMATAAAVMEALRAAVAVVE